MAIPYDIAHIDLAEPDNIDGLVDAVIVQVEEEGEARPDAMVKRGV
eukprot:COSAG06_NODE_71509_length_183_cov_19.023810_1_plen_45_part_01